MAMFYLQAAIAIAGGHSNMMCSQMAQFDNMTQG